MRKKGLIFIVLLGLMVILWAIFYNKPKSSPSQGIVKGEIKEVPSDTLIEYSDPSGFTFSYPDNLSIKKSEEEGANSYADLQLSSTKVNGSLILRIVDSGFSNLDEWIKSNKTASVGATPKEVSLGKLKGLELQTEDRLYLGALDQGILFTIEIPLIETDFWSKVYNKVLESFTFVSPPQNTNSTSSDVSFEEEVVE